jgi:hypothetical protein
MVVRRKARSVVPRLQGLRGRAYATLPAAPNRPKIPLPQAKNG